MLVCPGCNAENWVADKHFVFVQNAPAFVVCRKCKKELDLDIGDSDYDLEWHRTLSESTTVNVMRAEAAPGVQLLAPKFEFWLMKLMRSRDRHEGDAELAAVVEEMKNMMKPQEHDDNEEEVCC